MLIEHLHEVGQRFLYRDIFAESVILEQGVELSNYY